MAQFSLLSSRLKAVDLNAELEISNTYLVRFQKPNKMIWIGVVIPENIGPRRHTNKRPAEARPTSGEWTTPATDRMYSVYLPGCNTFRWIGTKQTFTIEASPPSIKEDLIDRPVAKLFRSVLAIVKQKPSLQFWLDMLKQEQQEKGRTTTDLRLCMPNGYNIVLEEDGQSASEPSVPDKPAVPDKPSVLDDCVQEPPSKVQATSHSFSTSRALAVSNGDEFSNSVEQDNAMFVPFDADAGTRNPAMNADTDGDMSTQTSATVHGFYFADEPTIDGLTTPPVNPPSPEASMEEVEVEVEARNQSHGESIEIRPAPLDEFPELLFDMPLLDFVKTAISNDSEVLRNIHLAKGILEMLQSPQGFFIRSFFKTHDFCPCLILKDPEASAEDSDNEEQATLRIGDVRMIGTRYKLEDVHSADVLRGPIIALGELYMLAGRLRLDALIDKIVMKLQVVWNSYEGVSMLADLLTVAREIFDASNVSASFDGMQNWFVAFIADIMPLFLYKNGAEFNQVMSDCPILRDAVFEKYSKKLSESPERYANPLVWLRRRGVKI
ncbi:hypothetical protein N7474_004154 [Penicillium riverlandense]|uniref:uncharacterized protein n=1 Tax=Penicillium riverlandense TaxID=1903569 RepID=UPI00254667E3|nr:uncharacterized protein N7474_004154 [Penicillium riverlandense]KAJ5818563.1 hypothetical protein N7474_004154 [Penicillium riverlandense]